MGRPAASPPGTSAGPSARSAPPARLLPLGHGSSAGHPRITRCGLSAPTRRAGRWWPPRQLLLPLLLLQLLLPLPRRARSPEPAPHLPEPSPRCSHARGWVMSTAPSLSALRSSKHSGGGGSGAEPAWTSALSGNCSRPGPGSPPAGSSSSTTKPFVHAVPPSDPLRQANRLPIKVLKMLTARTGHILHPEYLQPLPSTPVSPIEVRGPS